MGGAGGVNAETKGLANGTALMQTTEGGVLADIGDLELDRGNRFDLKGQQVGASTNKRP